MYACIDKYLKPIVTEQLCDTLQTLTDDMVKASKQFNEPYEIKQFAQQQIKDNIEVLMQLEYRPSDMKIPGHILDHLTVANFKQFLCFVGSHCCIAHKLGWQPQLQEFKITECYQNYRFLNTLSSYIGPSFQLRTEMERYEGKYTIHFYPNEVPDHEFTHSGGTEAHELVRKFNSNLFSCMTPNEPFSATHSLEYINSRPYDGILLDPEKHIPSGGYIDPFYAGFGCTVTVIREFSLKPTGISL